MPDTNVQIRLLEGFEDTSVSPEIWNGLLNEGSSDSIFITWHWQKAWWDAFGRGRRLLIILAEKNNIPITIAPFFTDGGMIFFIGSGGSDYLDLIGDVTDRNIIEEIMRKAVQQVQGFLGFRLYHMTDRAVTSDLLKDISDKWRWQIYEEGGEIAPGIELKKYPEESLKATQKKSLLRHENWFKKNGELEIMHLENSIEVMPLLDIFFKQHIERWSPTSFPSLFLEDAQKLFYKKLTETLSEMGWLRFTYVKWNGRYIAFHFGWNYKGSFFWYKPTFDIGLAKKSPGEVLLKSLLIEAISEDAHIFDFGLGEESFKKRFSTNLHSVRTWGLYPSK